eukprot:scaffold92094_cov55-Attheya_sp.AAC.2
MIPSCCPRWKLEFYKPGHRDRKVIIRDEGDNTVTVEPWQSPLLAVCMAYAMDRLTNRCTNEVANAACGVVYVAVAVGAFAAVI